MFKGFEILNYFNNANNSHLITAMNAFHSSFFHEFAANACDFQFRHYLFQMSDND